MIIYSSKKFVLQRDAEEYLHSISYRKSMRHPSWPWLATTGLVRARVQLRANGFFYIEYMVEKEVGHEGTGV